MPQVPGVPGVTVIWPALQATERPANFRNPGGASRWHTDLVHERQPAGITHLHNDCVPKIGGDTLWASGYSAYEKLSPDFRKIIDGKKAYYKSAHTYLDRNDPEAGPKHIERIHPIVRVSVTSRQRSCPRLISFTGTSSNWLEVALRQPFLHHQNRRSRQG